MEAKRKENDIFKMLKEKKIKLLVQNLYPAIILLKSKGKIKTVSGKQKLGEFIASRLSLKEMKEDIFQAERNTRQKFAPIQRNKEKW